MADPSSLKPLLFVLFSQTLSTRLKMRFLSTTFILQGMYKNIILTDKLLFLTYRYFACTFRLDVAVCNAKAMELSTTLCLPLLGSFLTLSQILISESVSNIERS